MAVFGEYAFLVDDVLILYLCEIRHYGYDGIVYYYEAYE
jgi:hypothetical protein